MSVFSARLCPTPSPERGRRRPVKRAFQAGSSSCCRPEDRRLLLVFETRHRKMVRPCLRLGDKCISLCRGNLAKDRLSFRIGSLPLLYRSGGPAVVTLVSSRPRDQLWLRLGLRTGLLPSSRQTRRLPASGPVLDTVWRSADRASAPAPHSGGPAVIDLLGSRLRDRLWIRCGKSVLDSLRNLWGPRIRLRLRFSASGPFSDPEWNLSSGLPLGYCRTRAPRSPSLCAYHAGYHSPQLGHVLSVPVGTSNGLFLGIEPCPCLPPWSYQIRTAPRPGGGGQFLFLLSLSTLLFLSLSLSPALSWPLSTPSPTNSLASSSPPVSPAIPSPLGEPLGYRMRSSLSQSFERWLASHVSNSCQSAGVNKI
ncbi:uncharacterized protein [Apostichopus japonicus]|uniref:uncharacterized protein n=1 Tax=Stichopus japonicus TaxID=307972 RepID=UPI003AB4262C